MRYLVLGAGGMAGHMITSYLLEQGEYVDGIARRQLEYCNTLILDVTELEQLEEIIINNKYDYVINCVGILNNDAEQHIDKAIIINSYLPHFLVKVTESLDTRVIHLSTDCVFSGKRGKYTEIDIPDGETIYDRTKALGEIKDNKNLTFRNSIIGPDVNSNGIGLFNWFMHQKGEIGGFEKSIWTGVTTLTLARAIHKASYSKLTGLYNLVNNEVINKYELLCLFKKYTGKQIEINKIDGIVHDKSLCRTRNDFEFVVPSYEDQIKEMCDWIRCHTKLYPHYIVEE